MCTAPGQPSNALPPSKPVIRIVLVGKQRVVLDSLANLIAGEPDLKVVGESAPDGSVPVASGQADIVLFDMDEADDDIVFERLRSTARTIRTIAVSISEGTAVSFRVCHAGAWGLVSKRHPPAALLMAIRKVHAGEAWLGRTIFAHVLDMARANRRNTEQIAESGSAALSARDRQLIALVGEGWRNADIARHIVASEATVRASLTSIFRKLGIPNRFALMIYASQHGYTGNTDRPRPPMFVAVRES
jgi:DNA-binding NarL/FixJ family response regulator